MDDDDDSGLLDLISDPQALNYFLHGSGNKSADDELTSASFSASNSNSIFANANHADPKSSIKGVHNQGGEGSSDGLQLSNSLQFLEDELEPSPIHDLGEDQPFDILQESLQAANITEQTLAEEAYLDASIGSSQSFAHVPIHSHSSTSFTQATNYSGQTLHSVGVAQVPVVQQQGGASFASSTVGMQPGFMQHVGIIPSQHMSNSNHSSSGQIQLIGPINNQSPVMAINNFDGSHIIVKSGQQPSANPSGGLVVQRHSQNGNAMYGNSNSSPAGQPVAVPFNSGNFQTSLPVHNIIIHRGTAPNANKIPINIQPKPIQVGQHSLYNTNSLGMQQQQQQQHAHHGVPFAPTNSHQSSAGSQQMPINQQGAQKQVGQQQGGSIVIHSPMGQSHGHPNQFLIPTGLPVSSSSVQHIQTINSQLVQTQQSHLGPNQVSANHVMLSRNPSNMVRPNQPYSGQMLNSPGTTVQIVPGQTFMGPGGQVILNHGTSQIVGGQMSQVSPTILHLSPGQSSTAPSRSRFSSLPPGGPNMPAANRFTILSSGTVLQGMGPSFQSSTGGENFVGNQQQNRGHTAVSESHLQGSSANPTNVFCTTAATQPTFSCVQTQKTIMNPLSPGPSLQSQDNSRQPNLPSILGNSSLAGHNSGNKHLHHSLPLAQENVAGAQLQNMEVDVHVGGMKRPSSKQLAKESLTLQQLQQDQEHVLLPDKTPFRSLNDALQRLIPYHVYQGSLPTEEDLQKVDNEFEAVATNLLKKTQSMLNKYRLLLMEDAMRINPSAEMVMLDRIFNQEERATLTREKRFAVIDPDGYLAEFCCSSKYQENPADEKQTSTHDSDTSKTSTEACQTVTVQQDQTDLAGSRTSDNICSVPKNNVAEKANISYSKEEGLNKCDKLKKIGCSPRKLLQNSCKRKAFHDEKSIECSSKKEIACKMSKQMDNAASPQTLNIVNESNLETEERKLSRQKTPGACPESDDRPSEFSRNPGKHFKDEMPSETLKANASELKASGKHLESKVSGSNSTELESEKSSPTASDENCVEQNILDTKQGVAETDSVLEAAVNSILEC
ncbi:BRD4-interacting chromatin-remodeling complex-associated protein-like [Rhinophrynus dorsalis]